MAELAWLEDGESKFIDYKVPAKDGGDDRVVRVRVRPAPSSAGGSLITFESESDISDLQSGLHEWAKIIAKAAVDDEVIVEDRGVIFRGVGVMTYVSASSRSIETAET